MSEAPISANFGLPMLVAGQARKDLTVNEALLLVDWALDPQVEGEAADPATLVSPHPGEGWIVGDPASGLWEGREGQVAIYSANGWRFLSPPAGFGLLDRAQSVRLVFDGSDWQAPPALVEAGSNAEAAHSRIDEIVSLLQHFRLTSA